MLYFNNLSILTSSPSFFQLYFFYLFFILITLSLFLLSTNPVTKLFFKISIFLLTGLFFFEQALFFLAISYIIVYVGAIAILFIFVIMLLPTYFPLRPINSESFIKLYSHFPSLTHFFFSNSHNPGSFDPKNPQLGLIQPSQSRISPFLQSRSTLFSLSLLSLISFLPFFFLANPFSNLHPDFISSFLQLHSINWFTSFFDFSDIFSFAFLTFLHFPLSIFLLSLLLFIVLIGLLAISI